jgi:hypothetical protein
MNNVTIVNWFYLFDFYKQLNHHLVKPIGSFDFHSVLIKIAVKAVNSCEMSKTWFLHINLK